MPQNVIRRSTYLVVELAPQASLSDPRLGRDRDEAGGAALEHASEQLREKTQVCAAADKGSLETALASRPASSRLDAHRPEQAERLGLPLHRVLARVLEHDRPERDLARDLVDEHPAWRCR